MNKTMLHNDRIQLYHGDCLEVMPTLPAQSIDLILADLPYGTSNIIWDSIIPLDKLWKEYQRLCVKLHCVLFGINPFSSILVSSNIKDFRYDWIWEKDRCSNFANAKHRPMRNHEQILVFSDKKTTYNPIKQKSTSQNTLSKARNNYIVPVSDREWANSMRFGTKKNTTCC